MQLKAMIEGLLFLAGDEGLTIPQLSRVLDSDETAIIEMMQNMQTVYKSADYGFELVEVAGAYKLMTKPELAPYIDRLLQSPRPSKLSQAALETLAIIAYNQPVAKADIEDIRGVKTERVIQTLVSHALIKEVGRAEGVGRAILYGTTQEFLEHFGLKALDDLPPFPEELQMEDQQEMALFEHPTNSEDADGSD